MSDLISRSKVISVLEQLEEHSLSGKMYISNAIYLLEKQPTAYDVGKVVEKLEACKDIMLSPNNFDCFGEECKYNDCMVCVFANAIEIVKQEAEQYNNVLFSNNRKGN